MRRCSDISKIKSNNKIERIKKFLQDGQENQREGKTIYIIY